MNGILTPRRVAKPIRLSLAEDLGGEIDGSWWPHSSMIAAELPDLVGGLHNKLGEIVDIRINWSPSDGQYELGSVATGVRLNRTNGPHRRPRLMVVVGQVASAKLLVIPSMTSQALGAIVMRMVAGLPTWSGSGDADLFATAQVVIGVAKAELVRWPGAASQ
ncbi:DUF5994 family protein [Mycobacterium sp. 236(2023)]|uniref:DUF5994 family protein n=1 Tax=Mycobacterium sp. 236(2023) TaxID=3038163 RepID=UPI0024152CC7|nr:DUF5994 family protein [Mycobacterium sp. 236(2023)]MDG4663658.1 DUF5994 family protein [Mycobacterium sp. 236(2023)]